jgi:hypothetical protein
LGEDLQADLVEAARLLADNNASCGAVEKHHAKLVFELAQ